MLYPYLLLIGHKSVRSRLLCQDVRKRGQNKMPDLLSWLLNQYAELVAAVRFLSILPLPGVSQRFETESTSASSQRIVLGSGYFSLVGFFIGLLLSLLTVLLNPLFAHLALAALLVVALVLLTGGLHLDGVWDSVDRPLGCGTG